MVNVMARSDTPGVRVEPNAGSDMALAGPPTTRRVISGALTLLSTQPITWTSSLLLTIFIPRLLDGRSLGEYTIAVTLAALVGEVVSLGVPTVLTRRIAAQPAGAVADITRALVLLVGLGIVVAVIAPLAIAGTGLLTVSTALLAVVFAGMVVTQGRSVLSAALTGYQWMGRYAWSNALVSVAITALSIFVRRVHNVLEITRQPFFVVSQRREALLQLAKFAGFVRDRRRLD